MSLTIKHLNNDASFLLTFEPIQTFPPSPDPTSENAFTMVLDPWLDGASKIFHSKFSISTHKQPSCISSLADLPEPDLVIISQDKTDHCHEPTLKTLPPSGGKTMILAEPASAKLIRGWKHFDPEKICTLQRWDEKKPHAIHRIHLPALDEGGSAGEITVAFLSQKMDITGLHSAIGITYQPPTYSSEFDSTYPLPPTPPASPQASIHQSRSSAPPRTLSVIFSPHGISYSCLEKYASSHLVSKAALPLTALLHSFDRISNPWYLGGNICAGFPGGVDIAQNLLARAWVSAHDGDKDTKGLATVKLNTQQFDRQEIENVVSPRSAQFPERKIGTEVVVLGAGEELRLGQEAPYCGK